MRAYIFIPIFIILTAGSIYALPLSIYPLELNASYGNNSYNIFVYNPGSYIVNNLAVSIGDFYKGSEKISGAIYPIFVNIGPGENKLFTLTLHVDNSKTLGTYTGNIIIANSTDFLFSELKVNLLNDSSGPKIIDYSPKLKVNSPITVLQVATDKKSVCRYSKYPTLPYDAMEGVFDFNYETYFKKTLENLNDGVYRYYVKCKDDFDRVGEEKEVAFTVSLPVSAIISLSENSPLKTGKFKLALTTSKVLSQPPSLSYSFDSITYNSLPLGGSGSSWIGYLIIPSTLGETVLSFKFLGRDSEGNLGDEITSGNVFLVDTTKPRTVLSTDTLGNDGNIRIRWYFDGEETKFNIYKDVSPSLSYNDFYTSVSGESVFYDTSVENGKKYYYRIAAVDEAGNVGDLSPEVYGISTSNTSSVSGDSGLSLGLRGYVDNFLTEADMLLGDAENVQNSVLQKTETERKIFIDLKLDQEIESAKSEISSLRREAENYKLQDLSEIELTNKLNSARLKLNVIKKKIPENLLVLEEKSGAKSVSEEDISSALLEAEPEISESDKEKSISETMKMIKDSKISIKRYFYALEIAYLDGTTKEISLIEEEISSELEKQDNTYFIVIIPKDITEKSSELDIKNFDFQVIKEDPVISFSSDTKKIVYSLSKRITNFDDIKISPVKILNSNTTQPITGFFAFNLSSQNKYIGIIFIVIVLSALVAYFIFFRMRKMSDNAIEILKNLEEGGRLLNEEKIEYAEKIYKDVMKSYNLLSKREKKKIFKEIEGLRGDILFHYFKKLAGKIKNSSENKMILFKSLEKLHSSMPDEFKAKANSLFEEIKTEVKNEI